MLLKRWQYALSLAGLAWVLVSPLNPQTAQTGRDRPLRHAFRSMHDPHTGLTWVVETDPKHAGGPGRMILAEGDLRAGGDGSLPDRILIHAGQKVIVEQHTPLLDAAFEALALNPALAGSGLKVRLRATGKVMSAYAISKGKAVLLPSTEARP